jgi:hypothetical protein
VLSFSLAHQEVKHDTHEKDEHRAGYPHPSSAHVSAPPLRSEVIAQCLVTYISAQQGVRFAVSNFQTSRPR